MNVSSPIPRAFFLFLTASALCGLVLGAVFFDLHRDALEYGSETS